MLHGGGYSLEETWQSGRNITYTRYCLYKSDRMRGTKNGGNSISGIDQGKGYIFAMRREVKKSLPPEKEERLFFGYNMPDNNRINQAI